MARRELNRLWARRLTRSEFLAYAEVAGLRGSYLVPMTALIAGIVSALVGVLGVGIGAGLQGRDNRRRWLHDQKLHAAVDFIATTGDVYDHRLLGNAAANPSVERELWQRVQKSRSVLYLLCDGQTVKKAEELIKGVRKFKPTADHSGEDAVISLLRQLVELLRRELRTGEGQFDPALREPTAFDSSEQRASVSNATT
jgi:hypothetical protein